MKENERRIEQRNKAESSFRLMNDSLGGKVMEIITI